MAAMSLRTGIRRSRTSELTPEQLIDIYELLTGAFGDRFGKHNWAHTIGGLHIMVIEECKLVGHVAVVPRRLQYGRCELRTGYVEGAAVRRFHQRRGHGSRMMSVATEHVSEFYELGALFDGAGIPGFYQSHGWQTWCGPTYVASPGRSGAEPSRTPEEDGSVLVLLTARSGPLDLWSPLTCDWRQGDPW